MWTQCFRRAFAKICPMWNIMAAEKKSIAIYGSFSKIDVSPHQGIFSTRYYQFAQFQGYHQAIFSAFNNIMASQIVTGGSRRACLQSRPVPHCECTAHHKAEFPTTKTSPCAVKEVVNQATFDGKFNFKASTISDLLEDGGITSRIINWSLLLLITCVMTQLLWNSLFVNGDCIKLAFCWMKGMRKQSKYIQLLA